MEMLRGKQNVLRENVLCRGPIRTMASPTTGVPSGFRVLQLSRSLAYYLLISVFLISIGDCTRGSEQRELEQRALYQKNFGCETLGEKLTENPRTNQPLCGCGYYGERIPLLSHGQPEVRNVTVISNDGTVRRFECRKCRLCNGRKITRQCKPKQDTMCSDECEDCYQYNDFLKRCIPVKGPCLPVTTPSPPRPTTIDDQPTTDPPSVIIRIQQSAAAQSNTGVSWEPEEYPSSAGTDLHRWLIAVTVVTAFAIIAVLGALVYVMRRRTETNTNSNSTASIDSSTPCLNNEGQHV